MAAKPAGTLIPGAVGYDGWGVGTGVGEADGEGTAVAPGDVEAGGGLAAALEEGLAED